MEPEPVGELPRSGRRMEKEGEEKEGRGRGGRRLPPCRRHLAEQSKAEFNSSVPSSSTRPAPNPQSARPGAAALTRPRRTRSSSVRLLQASSFGIVLHACKREKKG